MHKRRDIVCIAMALASTAIAVLPSNIRAQGSIFGMVRAADLSTPPDGAIQFVGFIHNSDREIRVQSCVGAGYDGGYWFDDFQNYLTEAPGIAYHYYFFDAANSETVLLNKTIPANSFQQEDITLAAGTFPPAVVNLEATRLDRRTVRIDWKTQTGTTWHVYRRDGLSDGSFFRVDNPAGDRNNRGVTVPYYVDNTVDSLKTYYYVVVAESTPGNYSPASDVLFVDVNSCCQGLVGDVNGVGGDIPSIGDVALLIDHLYISYTPPQCLAEADVNQSGGLHPTPQDISLVDVVLLINYLYIDFVPLRHCADAGQ